MNRSFSVAVVLHDARFFAFDQDGNLLWLRGLTYDYANASNSLGAKKDALQKDLATFQQKYEAGNTPPADLEKEYAGLQQRGQRLQEEEERLSKALGEEQKKAFNDLYANVEAKLKTLSSQIGYDYIFSYQRGGQILLANDSLDITRQVLELLNEKEKK